MSRALSELPEVTDVLRDFRRDAFARCPAPRTLLTTWGKEVRQLRFVQACLAEFFATFFFLAVCVTAVIFSVPAVAGTEVVARTVLLASVFGLTVTSLVYACSTSSGGHMNPAVSILLLARGAISLPRCLAFVIMQGAGAVMGTALARSLNPLLWSSLTSPACNRINYSLVKGMSKWTAWGGEIIATAVLAWVVLASGDVGTLPSTRRSGALNPLAIGLSVFIAHLVMIPIDGCSCVG